MRKVTAQSAVKFFRSIVCRFEIPNRIITDNGTQFTSRTFMQYVQDLGAKVCFASVAHPRSNGQAERANAEVLRGLKTRTFDRLHRCGRNWIEELPVVLWSIRTTPNRATGQTPFALVYGAEAILPTELIYGSPRVPLMTSLSKSDCGKMTQRSSRKIFFGRLCEQRDTSKPCAATIAARFVPQALRKATLFFGAFSRPRIPTS